jgi:hypothetical protein
MIFAGHQQLASRSGRLIELGSRARRPRAHRRRAVTEQGRTTFMIAHRLTTLENCDMLLVLEHGLLQTSRRMCRLPCAIAS